MPTGSPDSRTAGWWPEPLSAQGPQPGALFAGEKLDPKGTKVYHKCAGNVTFPWYAVLSNNKEGENHMNPMLKLLTRRSFAASRTRNLMAVLAIALTALLFTSVATIALGAMESMTLTMQVQKGSKSDGDFRNMTAQQYEALG